MNKITKTKLMIFASVFLTLLLIDLLLKYVFFEGQSGTTTKTGAVQHDWGVIGIRSNAHYGTTMLDSLGISITRGWGVVIFIVISVMFFVMLFFAKNKIVIIGFSMVLAGTFGNGLDTIYNGFVRNVLFIPWHDSGTFNLADLLIVTGAPVAAITTIYSMLKK